MRKEACLYEKTDNKAVNCFLCNHNCRISESEYGICRVRKNEEGTLYSLSYANPVACNIDPIEKKPLNHFYPGSLSYSIAGAGCNFKCGFCQNWQISQANIDEISEAEIVLPEQVVYKAKENNCLSISYTYTEPTIFFEYAYDIAKLAKEEGLKNVFVSNGYMSLKAIDKISPYLDAINIDLKSFSREFYRRNCSACLDPVLESIKCFKKKDIWVEITTLVIPNENDSEKELCDIAGFIASVGSEIPWHISRFHPDYKFLDYEPTPIETLKKAFDIAKKSGLKYVYLGNTSEGNDTYCYHCGKLLVKRSHFISYASHIDRGSCSYCSALIDGLF